MGRVYLLKQQREPGALLERQRLSPRQRVIAHHHGVQGRRNFCEEFDAGMTCEIEGEAEIGFSACDPACDIARPHAFDVEGDGGMGGVEVANGVGQEAHQQTIERGDLHKAALDPLERIDLASNTVEVG